MKFAFQINTSPHQSQAGESAYQFIVATLEKGHQVFRVFFYCDGVYHAQVKATSPQDETQVTQRWSQLAAQYNIDLVVCIAAAQRRGLLSQDKSSRQNFKDNDLAAGFRVSGLGQLVEATLTADRFIVFGKP